MAESLFSDFIGISTSDWMDRIQKDLKGKDPERLTRNNPDGLAIKPVYRQEDLPAHALDTHFLRGTGNPWSVHLPLDTTAEMKFLSEELMEGVESIGLPVEGALPDELGEQVKKMIALRLHLTLNADVADRWIEFLGKLPAEKPIKGSLQTGLLTGFIPHFAAAAQWIKDTEPMPDFRAVGLDLQSVYEESGSEVEELAMAIAQVVETIEGFSQKGIAADAVFSNLHFTFSAGPDVMLGMAKLRAFRKLISRLAEVYQVNLTSENFPPVLSVTSRRLFSWLDPHVNLLRGTTAALSAVVGGADAVGVRPWNAALGKTDMNALRIARNIPLLLRHESFLDRVIDPAGGSWYLESATESMAEKAWGRFQEIESKGGYLQIRNELDYTDRLADEATRLAKRKQIKIGVNLYPNANDIREIASGEGWGFARPDAVFESLRTRGLGMGAKQVFLFTHGNPAMRSARAGFAANLLGLAGLQIVENTTGGDISATLLLLKATPYDCIVFCSDNDSWANAPIEQVKAQLPHARLILAGKPESEEIYTQRGIHHCIYAGMDAPQFLSSLLDELSEMPS